MQHAVARLRQYSAFETEPSAQAQTAVLRCRQGGFLTQVTTTIDDVRGGYYTSYRAQQCCSH